MLVDWDTIAGWAGEKQGQKEGEPPNKQHLLTLSLQVAETIKTQDIGPN